MTIINDEALQKELFANAESDRRIKEQVYARLAGDIAKREETDYNESIGNAF